MRDGQRYDEFVLTQRVVSHHVGLVEDLGHVGLFDMSAHGVECRLEAFEVETVFLSLYAGLKFSLKKIRNFQVGRRTYVGELTVDAAEGGEGVSDQRELENDTLEVHGSTLFRVCTSSEVELTQCGDDAGID